MQGLNKIFSKQSNLLVLRVLYHADAPLTGREIERRCGLSNRATMMALEMLSEMAVAHCDQAANAYHYTLNRGHFLVGKAVKPALDAEEMFWDDLRKLVRRVVHPRPTAVVATGPIARDESLSEGRIELTMLFASSRNRLRAFRCMDDLAEKLWNRHSVSFEYNLVDEHNVDDEEYATLWRRIEREGVLLFGTLP